jgi:hypothetical protein
MPGTGTEDTLARRVINGMRFFFNVGLCLIELCFAIMVVNDGIMNNSAPAYPYRAKFHVHGSKHTRIYFPREPWTKSKVKLPLFLVIRRQDCHSFQPVRRNQAEYGHWLRRAIEAGA